MPELDPAKMFVALSVPASAEPLGNSLEAVQAHIQRQQLLSDVILGKANPDDYLDALATQKISVDRYLDEIDLSFVDFL